MRPASSGPDRTPPVRLARLAVVVVAAGLLGAGPTPAAADDRLEARQLVENGRFSVENFAADPNMATFRDLVKKARGVLIVPQLVRAGIIIGGSGGTGVLLGRDERTGVWSEPAFYTLGGASFGFQLGVDSSEVVLLFMTNRGVTTLLTNSLKLGGDASVALGPIGAGIGGATAGLSADVVTFSRSRGLYGGISLEGAVVAVRESLNSAYYGRYVTPVDILMRREVSNPESAGLVAALGRVSNPE
jgi:lipid-binding SYLF domain-containing protein